MKLIIPPECQIGAHTFKILWSLKILNIMECKGGAEYQERHVIRIRPDRPKTQVFQTLLHEVIHIGDFVHNRHREEEDIGHLASTICQCLLSMGIEPDFSQIPEEDK